MIALPEGAGLFVQTPEAGGSMITDEGVRLLEILRNACAPMGASLRG